MRHDVDVDEAARWVRSVVPGAGPLHLAHAEPWASVFTTRSSSEVVWFKACAPTHAFEVPLTASLAMRWPETVTEVLAHDVARRWLLMADAGEPLRASGNPPDAWERFLPAYAELQIGESGWIDEHLLHAVPDLRLERLPCLFAALLEAPLPIEPDERSALARLAPRFADLCSELGAAGIAPSVQHDDLHMNNLYAKGDELRVLDWGDASIAHPFFSLFEVFRFLREVNHLPPDDPWFGRLRDVYLEPWKGDRRDVFALAYVVGGFAHAIAWLHQRVVLPEADRAAFGEPFATILRLAMSSATGSFGAPTRSCR